MRILSNANTSVGIEKQLQEDTLPIILTKLHNSLMRRCILPSRNRRTRYASTSGRSCPRQHCLRLAHYRPSCGIPRRINWSRNRNGWTKESVNTRGATVKADIGIGYLGVARWHISSVVRKMTKILCFFCDTQPLADRLDFKSSRSCVQGNDRTQLKTICLANPGDGVSFQFLDLLMYDYGFEPSLALVLNPNLYFEIRFNNRQCTSTLDGMLG